MHLNLYAWSSALIIAVSANCSCQSAATARHLRRGRHTAANRGAQRHPPDLLPAFCDDSARSSLVPARHFSGNMAQLPQKLQLRHLALNQKRRSSERRFYKITNEPLLRSYGLLSIGSISLPTTTETSLLVKPSPPGWIRSSGKPIKAARYLPVQTLPV